MSAGKRDEVQQLAQAAVVSPEAVAIVARNAEKGRGKT
jgi:hypothetical protein